MQTARLSHNSVSSYNWGKPQPLGLDSGDGYIEAAYERRLLYREILDNFTHAAGPGAELVPPCVKGNQSVDRKLWDRTSTSLGQPDMIGDYLRARVLVPANPGATAQLSNAIEEFKDHALMVGFKDRILRPNGAAFRAFNGHIMVDGLVAELQIIPDDRHGRTRIVNQFTDGLRSAERALRHFEEVSYDGNHKLMMRAENSIGLIRDMRKTLHDGVAPASGADALIDAGLADKHKAPTKGELTALHRAVGRDYFASRALLNRLQEPMQVLREISMAAPARQMALQ